MAAKMCAWSSLVSQAPTKLPNEALNRVAPMPTAIAVADSRTLKRNDVDQLEGEL